MILHQTQKLMAMDNHRFRVVCCGRRWGKTTETVFEMVGKAVSKKNQTIAYVAPTYKQAKDIAWDMLKKVANPAAKKLNESTLEVIIKTIDEGTSRIILRGWEAIETFRGMKIDFLILDEVASYRNFWTGWHEVLRPCLTDTRGEAIFISTPKGYNHFFDLYNEESKDNDFKSFHFTSYDNPHIPKDEIDKAKIELPPDKFAQEYMAEFKKVEGLVFKEFNRDFHTFVSPPIDLKTTICGVDFGFTNPSAILKIGIDRDNTFWILEEFYKTGQTNEQLIEILKRYNSTSAYPDPAEPDRIQALVMAGINCRDVSKDIEAGIDRVRELFKQGRIKISKSCQNLIWELETYSYPDKKEGENDKETPIKDNDHGIDAMRYALYSYMPTTPINPFGQPINNRFI